MPDDAKLFRVDGLIAVITGAGSGLGRMMAHAIASNGASKVYILGRRLDALNQTAQDHPKIIPIQAGATSKPSLAAAADRITSETGYIHTLIVNSGVIGPTPMDMPRSGKLDDLQKYFWNYSAKGINTAFTLNNTGAFFTMVAFLGLLGAGDERPILPEVQTSVIFTASIAGFARSLQTGVAYIPSKAGTIQSAKLFSSLLAQYNIRVNVIAPGMYPSEMTGELLEDGRLVDTMPAHRAGSEKDMRGMILFLTSRAGAYINGDILLTDGGRLGQMPASF